MEINELLARRSTDQRVILHASASDYPPVPGEDLESAKPRVQKNLNPRGTVRLVGGQTVEATCVLPGSNIPQYIRSGAVLDPEKVKFSG